MILDALHHYLYSAYGIIFPKKLLCLTSKKSNREYYSSLYGKNITENKTFQKTVKKFFLLDKVTSAQKIIPKDNDEIVKNDDGTTRFFNIFFSNIVSDLKILDYNNCDPLVESIQEPVLKATLKYRNHPSILTMGQVCKRTSMFFQIFFFS